MRHRISTSRAVGSRMATDAMTSSLTRRKILDTGGNNSLSRLRRALTDHGTLVIVGGEGGRLIGGLDRQLRALLLSPFVSHKLGTFVAKENAEDLLVLNELIESGKVAPVFDRTYPLSEAADAIRHFEAGHPRGRIAITV